MQIVNEVKKETSKQIIPIVFAVDDNYAPFLSVAIRSILENADDKSFFKFYVLNTGISDKSENKLKIYNTACSSIEFVCVAERMEELGANIHLRDYFTQAIYYRIFIPDLFPQYDKILYLDSDLVLNENVAELFNIDLEDNILGAVPEEVVSLVEVFSEYSEKVIEVPKEKYFNSGLLLINAKEYRKERIEEKFINMMKRIKYVVAPDQDYLNSLCYGKVKILDTGWNKTPVKVENFDKNDLKIIHYKLWYKPWLYSNILYQEYFWKYAKLTNFYDEIKEIHSNYSEAKMYADILAYKNLLKTCKSYINQMAK